MSARPLPGDQVRVTQVDSDHIISVGDVVTVDTVESTGGVWAKVDGHDSLVWIGQSFEPIDDDADGLHRITERPDGPDLHDIVRLVCFLREHKIGHEIRSEGSFTDGDDFDPGWMEVVWMASDNRRHNAREGQQSMYHGLLVGLDGTVYDENREAL